MKNKDIMENYLLVLKSTVEVYVHGTLESANKIVRSVLNSGLDETLKCQEKTFHEMSMCGWYQVCDIKKDEICKTINKLKED